MVEASGLFLETHRIRLTFQILLELPLIQSSLPRKFDTLIQEWREMFWVLGGSTKWMGRYAE